MRQAMSDVEEGKLMRRLVGYRCCLHNHSSLQMGEDHARSLQEIIERLLIQIEDADFLSPERRRELIGRFLLPV